MTISRMSRMRPAMIGSAVLTAWAVAVPSANARTPAAAPQAAPVWGSGVVRHDDPWYKSDAARAIADAVIQYQSPQGGWPKNLDIGVAPRSAADIPGPDDGKANTIDNSATTLPLQFLARMIVASPTPAYRAAFDRGVAYLLQAQYPNGGWPQFYPLRAGYYAHVTFNDDAMVHVLTLLRDVAKGRPPYGFVDAAVRARAADAVARGTDLILRTQLKLDGRPAGWCAQYDERTLEPAWARKYEPPSLSGGETVGIVRFLMQIEAPSPAVVAAVEGAVAWLRTARITGVRVEDFTDDQGRRDRRVVADPAAGPIWARFYELGTGRPIFLDRDSVFRYSFAEIGHERRNGYGYYGTWPDRLLANDYPRWKAHAGR